MTTGPQSSPSEEGLSGSAVFLRPDAGSRLLDDPFRPSSVAAPLFDAHARAIDAISVAGPSMRLGKSRIPTVVRLLLFVDDQPGDVAGARDVGIEAMHFDVVDAGAAWEAIRVRMLAEGREA